MHKGSQPTDGGNLIILSKDQFIKDEPKSEPYIRQFMGAEDFIDSKVRWCLWLKNIDPTLLKTIPKIIDRLEKVKTVRLQSPTPSVRRFAELPYLFTQDRQPNTSYLIIPEVSSENRNYIPIGFQTPEVICANTVQIIPGASIYMFSILQSKMHMVFARLIAGRLESRIRYTPAVYNNFPWPIDVSEKNKHHIEEAGKIVLDERLKFDSSSLGDLYDPFTMPRALVKAHQTLDRVVDQAYRSQPFANDNKRLEFLFELYDKYIAELFPAAKPIKKTKNG